MKAEVENMELLNNQNESRKFYREVNTSMKPFKPVVSLVKDEDDNSDDQEILEGGGGSLIPCLDWGQEGRGASSSSRGSAAGGCAVTNWRFDM
jgi:hypothetical protein